LPRLIRTQRTCSVHGGFISMRNAIIRNAVSFFYYIVFLV
jgi:hypothetical protein